MEDKENSGGSANTSSSDDPTNILKNVKEIAQSKTPAINLDEDEPEEEHNTQDLSLRLELDESGSLRETQDQYRMFGRIESSPKIEKKEPQCDKETQEFQMSKSMDENQFSPVIKGDDSRLKDISHPNELPEVNEQSLSVSVVKGNTKRLLDSQGKYSSLI